MIIALLLVLVGIVLIVSNPILGLIPGILPSDAVVCRFCGYRYP